MINLKEFGWVMFAPGNSVIIYYKLMRQGVI